LKARVVTPDGNSEEFDILAEVMQGDTLAPFLFIMVLDYALRKAISGREQDLGFTLTPRRSRRHPTVVLTDLDYADDISLLSDSVEQAQELLNRVESECAKVGLRLNAKKTEVITYNILPEHPPLTTTEGTVLKEVKDFKYLGSWVNSTEQDLKVRKVLAWRALNGMTRLKVPLTAVERQRINPDSNQALSLYTMKIWPGIPLSPAIEMRGLHLHLLFLGTEELMVTDGMKESCHELIDNRQLNYHRYCQDPWLMERATVNTRKAQCMLGAVTCSFINTEPGALWELPARPLSALAKEMDQIQSLSQGTLSLQRATGLAAPAKGEILFMWRGIAHTTVWRFHTLPPPMQV
ncbi:hypothetical protein JOQ06_003960, partial [Pogonophryne albipinna]